MSTSLNHGWAEKLLTIYLHYVEKLDDRESHLFYHALRKNLRWIGKMSEAIKIYSWILIIFVEIIQEAFFSLINFDSNDFFSKKIRLTNLINLTN